MFIQENIEFTSAKNLLIKQDMSERIANNK